MRTKWQSGNGCGNAPDGYLMGNRLNRQREVYPGEIQPVPKPYDLLCLLPLKIMQVPDFAAEGIENVLRPGCILKQPELYLDGRALWSFFIFAQKGLRFLIISRFCGGGKGLN